MNNQTFVSIEKSAKAAFNTLLMAAGGPRRRAPIADVPTWLRRAYRRVALNAILRQGAMPVIAGGAKGIALGRLFDLVGAFQPLDLQTARDGDYLSLKNCQHVTVLIYKGVGTDGDDPSISFQQAVDVAGTSAKDLATIDEYWEKEAATDLTGTGVWTRVTQTASATVTPGDPSAQNAAMYVFEIDADELDLDAATPFDCIRVRIADTGTNAQLGTAIYILSGLRHKTSPQNQPNSIID